MKKSGLLKSILFLATVSSLAHAEDLVIGNGQTYVINENQRQLHLQKFIVGDKAVIQFADNVTYWDMSADDVEIGQEVVIDGRGKAGATGATVAVSSVRADDCKNGASGTSGAPGAAGANGVDIQMRLTISKLGSMKIDVSGGRGGAGGDGAKGQQGGLAKSCDPTSGGNGGDGGQGGNGGNGGKLIVSLSSSTGTQSLMAISHQIQVDAEGGQGAPGGKPGDGGDGSEGKFINQKTLTGDKKWISGGKQGHQGEKGGKGNDGHEGRVFIGGGELNVAPIQAAAANAPETPTPAHGDQELEQLKTQLQLLEKRVDRLEKSRN